MSYNGASIGMAVKEANVYLLEVRKAKGDLKELKADEWSRKVVALAKVLLKEMESIK